MPRIVIISIVVLSVLLLAGIKARQSGYKTLSLGLFAAAAAYALISLGGFTGLLGG